MEEEETKYRKDTSGKDHESHKDGNSLDDDIGISKPADLVTDVDHADNVDGGTYLNSVSPASPILDNDLFDHVVVKDMEKSGTEMDQFVAIGSEDTFEFSFPNVPSLGFDSLPAIRVEPQNDSNYDINESLSPASIDASHSYGDFGYYSDSPQKPKSRQAAPDVPPELLHLVDSAIMGKLESLEKLKNVVSGVERFGGDDDAVAVAYLVVDSLLGTMGVESFEENKDDNPPSVMLNSRAAIVAGELIPSLPDIGDYDGFMSPRTKMARGLLAILCSCTRNRAMCSAAGLLRVLLRSAERMFVHDTCSTDEMKWDGTNLCYCIKYLAGHSLSPHDLYYWLQVINRTLRTVWASRLLHSLEKAMTEKEVRGPSSTFEFDGESSGLLCPGESKWPFTNGYAFATWIYIESFADNISTATTAAAIAMAAFATSGKSSPMSAAAAASALAGESTAHMPRLFSFLSADNQGMEAYFQSQYLVVEYGSGKGRKASLHFTHPFKPQCWYFIGLEHTFKQGLLGKSESELRLYIDGSLYETRPFDLPRISRPLAFCCIGTNPPPTIAGLQRRRRHCSLFAEMGPIYIFKEPIGAERMARLARRGGDDLPSFGTAAGSTWLATNNHVHNMANDSALLDVEIAGCLHLLYHPNLLNGRYCPDASPVGAAGVLRRPAEVLGQVHVSTRMRPAEALWALAHGGPILLLPLAVSSVNEHTLQPQKSDLSSSLATTALAAPIFRIVSLAIRYPGNNDEFCRRRGPEILSRVLNYLLQTLSSLRCAKRAGHEELVAAIVSLCQSQKFNHALKVQLFSMLLLDLRIWRLCSYGLQKKLLSSLADMVLTESSVMRDANAIQMLLDGCRRCYWIVRETDSVNTFSTSEDARVVGEVNALVDELLVVIELLILAAPPSLAPDDIRCLLGFMVACPQLNQVARVLLLIYRLVVQPNRSRAQSFAEAFISSGGMETLLVLLQRETKAGDYDASQLSTEHHKGLSSSNTDEDIDHGDGRSFEREDLNLQENDSEIENLDTASNSDRMSSISGNPLPRNLGGISYLISAENARNNAYNSDRSDGIIIGIINLLGALVISGHLKFDSLSPSDITSNIHGFLEAGDSMFDDKVSLCLFGIQKAFKTAPNRLLTYNAYKALLVASINASSSEDGLNFHEPVPGHRFENFQILSVLLCSLRYASTALQSRALQDLLMLVCGHPENISSITRMDQWPEWILETLISNNERGGSKNTNLSSLKDVEDFIHHFLMIILEHSMRQKDGWKDIEATIHCAEWLCMVGGSSIGDLRIRREESLPIFKRRLLGSLLDFAARELQNQTQVIAAAAAGVAAGGLSPKDAKIKTENAAQLSVALVENAIVILMLVEDHLRLQCKLYCASSLTTSASPSSSSLSVSGHSSNAMRAETSDPTTSRNSSTSDSGRPSLNALASMVDANGQISTAEMERLTAAVAAEPYKSVSFAFVSYGSCVVDLSEGWKYRSRLWYGVGLPPTTSEFGGGGSGWESWRSALEKDANGNWIELPLLKKSVSMLQTLLLEESGLGGGLGIGGGSGTGMGGMAALYQLLDSDQPFFCMLRMVLASLREDDDGEHHMLPRHVSTDDRSVEGFRRQTTSAVSLETITRMPTRKPRSALLWSVLSPILNMPISETKRQRVLVASCVLYSEMWHAIGMDRTPLRKQYLETIVPPFVAVLRRWRPILAGIHDLATADGVNPLVVDDQVLEADALPVEAALAMLSPNWAASFASPPAAMALSMIAAGAGGGEASAPLPASHLRRDSSLLERKTAKLHTFSSFQQPLEAPSKSQGILKDKAAAKAAALAAARDLERNSKIGSGRGLSAVAMATSAHRRSQHDSERVKRWNVSEAMGTAWKECLHSMDSKSVYGKDFNALSYKYIAVLVGSLAFPRNMKRFEVDRRSQADIICQHQLYTGKRAWRKLIHCLIDMRCLFGPISDDLCKPKRVVWKLDSIESDTRMRRILRRNYQGSDHHGATANYLEQKQEKHEAVSPSNAYLIAAEAIKSDMGNEEEDDSYSEYSPNSEQPNDIQKISSSDHSLNLGESLDPPVTDVLDSAPIPTLYAPGYIPFEHNERIVLEVASSMVHPLKVLKGTFQITTRRINFIIDRMENSAMRDADCKGYNEVQEKDRCWLISSLHQIYSRRYLLRRSALELFMVDRSNYFFDFGSTEGRRNAYQAIVQARPPHLNNVYLATQRPEQLLKRTQLMERWARREISNFEYLMHLNTLAGRSYNDITQYPVFPWVLSDYISQNIDLSNPSSFRDLSKPIGALNSERLRKFQERYSSFEDPVIPKFQYSSHYSTAGTVLYYLARIEPFTSVSIQRQGGKLDRADRMFSDIAATWSGVLEDTSDVKELVPELFYLPEVLTNENSIDFGSTEKLGPVRLPPWAKNPIDFVDKHRMALESEHVSDHLHEWIDLIFGYKQRGKEAIQANNVFCYITYEGTVDIDKISDPVRQRATQDQIAYFGQTPSQLLTVPHMKRMPLGDVLHMQTIFRNPSQIKPYVVPYPERCNLPAAAIRAYSDSLIIVDTSAPEAHIAHHKWQPNTPDGQGTPFLFQHGKPDTDAVSGTFARMFKSPTLSESEEWRFPQALAFPCSGIQSTNIVSITCDGEIITGGHVDNSIRLISADGARTLEIARGHHAPVTSVAISRDSNYLVSGSRDATVLIWRIHRSSISHSVSLPELSGNPSTPRSPSSAAMRNNLTYKKRRPRIEGPVHVLRGHLGEIICCAINSDLGVVASCSNSSDILLHSIRKGRLLRRFLGVEAHSVCLSSDGIIIAWNKYLSNLSTYTLNGVLISKKQLPASSTISCMEVSIDGRSALVGLNPSLESDHLNAKHELNEENREELPLPSICFFDLYTLKIFHALNLAEKQDIISVALNQDNTNLLVSTADKQLIIFTDPSLESCQSDAQIGSGR